VATNASSTGPASLSFVLSRAPQNSCGGEKNAFAGSLLITHSLLLSSLLSPLSSSPLSSPFFSSLLIIPCASTLSNSPLLPSLPLPLPLPLFPLSVHFNRGRPTDTKPTQTMKGVRGGGLARLRSVGTARTITTPVPTAEAPTAAAAAAVHRRHRKKQYAACSKA